MHTIRLIYASVARPEHTGYADLTALLHRAAQFNEEQALTGLLVYGNGMFLQVLEGERSAVNHLYNRIAADKRHERCTLLSAHAISERKFSHWAMKLVGIDDMPTAPRRAILLRFSGQSHFDPFLMTDQQAFGFLCAMGDVERQAAA